MIDFAQALLNAGAVEAGYTDGGGSTALVTRTQIVGSSERRPVASWLIVKPSATEPVSISPILQTIPLWVWAASLLAGFGAILVFRHYNSPR